MKKQVNITKFLIVFLVWVIIISVPLNMIENILISRIGISQFNISLIMISVSLSFISIVLTTGGSAFITTKKYFLPSTPQKFGFFYALISIFCSLINIGLTEIILKMNGLSQWGVTASSILPPAFILAMILFNGAFGGVCVYYFLKLFSRDKKASLA